VRAINNSARERQRRSDNSFRPSLSRFHSGHSPLISSFASLVTHHLPLVTAFLIDTPRLENPATRTKQSLHFDPNRDKMWCLHPLWRNTLFFGKIPPAGIRLLRLPRGASYQQILTANDNPTRIVILSDQRESKDLSCRVLQCRSQHSKLLIENPRLELELSPIKMNKLKFSNRK
jgi:hypothetical protein